MEDSRVTIRRVRIGLVVAVLLLVGGALWLARDALFPFVLSAILAYVIAPVVERLSMIQPWHRKHPQVARGTAVLSIYTVVGAVLTIIAIFAIPAVVREVDDLIEAVPELSTAARERVDGWIERYNQEVPEELRTRVDEALQQAGSAVTGFGRNLFTRSVGIVFSTIAALVGYIAVPFFVFYLLKDRDQAAGKFYALFPPGLQPDVRECVRIANHAFGAYVRGQLLLGLVIFGMTYVGLRVMDVQFSLALAVVAGITELIPIIGPVLGAIPAIIVVLATEPDHWWWVILFYLGVQGAENYLLVPRIHSRTVSMHPALVLVLLAVGGALFGIWGLLLVVPVAATLRDVFIYVYRRLQEEEIGNPSPAL